MWYETTSPFPNFSGNIVEVWEWKSNFIPHIIEHMLVYPCLRWFALWKNIPWGKYMLKLSLIFFPGNFNSERSKFLSCDCSMKFDTCHGNCVDLACAKNSNNLKLCNWVISCYFFSIWLENETYSNVSEMGLCFHNFPIIMLLCWVQTPKTHTMV